MSKYNFNNTRYIAENGKAPKGSGLWWFETEDGDIIRATFVEHRTLAEAKKIATKMAQEMGIPNGSTLYVI